MVGYDIQSLFTNIPVDETCDITSDKKFPQQDNIFNGYFEQIKKKLDNCTEDHLFIFHKKYITLAKRNMNTKYLIFS